jgi:plasmid stability protein
MATLTIKNIPERLVRRLKTQAALHRRSLNHEVIVCLETATQAAPVDPETLLAHARTLRRTPMRFRVTDRTLAKLKTSGRP